MLNRLNLLLRAAIGLYLTGAGLFFVVTQLLPRLRSDQWLVEMVRNFTPFVLLPLLVLLPLSLLLRVGRRLTVLAGLGLVVWLVLYGPLFLPKAVAEGQQTIRVATYNTWKNRPDTANLIGWLEAEDADVVFLQELHSHHIVETMAALDALYPYRASYEPTQEEQADPTRIPVLNYGNVIYSRYPFTLVEELRMDNTGIYPLWLRAVVDLNGKEVALYNVHLLVPLRNEAHISLGGLYSGLGMYYDDSLRNGQIELLVEAVAAEPLPFIVGGDFNTSDQDVMYPVLASVMTDSFRERGTGFGGSWPTPGMLPVPSFFPPLVRIDYLWHSPGISTQAIWQGPRVGSDHLPLIADFVVGE